MHDFDAELFLDCALKKPAATLKWSRNTINVEASKDISEQSAKLAEPYDRMSGYKGGLSDLLTAGAKALAIGRDTQQVRKLRDRNTALCGLPRLPLRASR